jgi:hypothetical protein
MIRVFATVSVLLGCIFLASAAPAAQQNECKACRDDYQACIQAHSKDACKTNFDICLKHCQRNDAAFRRDR